MTVDPFISALLDFNGIFLVVWVVLLGAAYVFSFPEKVLFARAPKRGSGADFRDQ